MMPRFFIIMGVAGSGKTSVGQALATQLGWEFYDADDFHPPANIAKMASGTPLNDEDRAPWLAALQALIATCLKNNRPGVLACSALKERYRQHLLAGNSEVQIVYLKGSYELLWARLQTRIGHYMKASMLHSQLATLEEPTNAIVIDITLTVEESVALIQASANQ